MKPLPKGLWLKEDGTIALQVCPKCNRENYAFNVTLGICTWCAYDANEDHQLTQKTIAKNDNTRI